MRILLFLLIIPIFLFSQHPKIIDMQGMTNEDGNTHIVYRQYDEFKLSSYSYFRSDVYNLNISTSIDTLLWDSFEENVVWEHGAYTGFFDFWNNNPFKEIRLGYAYSVDGVLRINSYFDEEGSSFLGVPINNENIIISKLTPKNIYASLLGFTIVSTDSGKTWPDIYDSTNISYPLISVNPFDDSIMFVYNNSNKLLISIDEGENFLTSQNSDIWSGNSKMLFDKDQKHAYAITNTDQQNFSTFLVSNEKGKPFTWEKYSIEGDHWAWDYWNGQQYYHLAIDDSVSGKLYAGFMNELYISSDYGAEFNLTYSFPSQITGLYKKPKTDTLFISNAYKIYSFNETDSSIKILKDSTPSNLDKFYPINTGNYWLYKTSDYNWDDGHTEYYTKKWVIGDTLLPNNHLYKIIQENGYSESFQRFDTLNGLVLEYSDWDSSEFVLFDLKLVPGDRHNYNTQYYAYIGLRLVDEVDDLMFDENLPQKHYYTYESLSTENLHLGEKFGKIYEDGYYDFGNYQTILQGAVIRGIVYGDTTVTALEDFSQTPRKFSLAQNYPNPFNPTTVINYELKKRSFVKLTIYDVGGREIETLVNKNKPAGKHKITFNGQYLATGVYYYRIIAGDFVQTKKMILIR